MKPSILYVDDEPENLRAFKSVFRRDYQIEITESANAGLKYLEEHDVDLVITDQRMPEMTGVEFLKKVFEKFPGLPPARMILSGYSRTKDIEEAKSEFLLSKFISKPWDPEELKKSIDSTIDQSSN